MADGGSETPKRMQHTSCLQALLGLGGSSSRRIARSVANLGESTATIPTTRGRSMSNGYAVDVIATDMSRRLCRESGNGINPVGANPSRSELPMNESRKRSAYARKGSHIAKSPSASVGRLGRSTSGSMPRPTTDGRSTAETEEQTEMVRDPWVRFAGALALTDGQSILMAKTLDGDLRWRSDPSLKIQPLDGDRPEAHS